MDYCNSLICDCCQDVYGDISEVLSEYINDETNEIDTMLPLPRPKHQCSKLISNTKRLQLNNLRNNWTSSRQDNINVSDYWDKTTLIVKNIKKGYGRRPSYGEKVVIRYSIHELNGLCLDYSNKNYTFRVGDSRVLYGLNKGIVQMRVGEQAKLYIPSEMGYGWEGLNNTIKPHTDLIMKVTLLKIKNKIILF
jgi:FKBP-type peptidyl-prolyl cis-trans isomerase